MSRQLAGLRFAVMVLEGLELKGRTMIVAPTIGTEGVKIPLRLWEASTENATAASAMLSDPVRRGLDPEQGCCSCSTDQRRCANSALPSLSRSAASTPPPLARGALPHHGSPQRRSIRELVDLVGGKKYCIFPARG